MERIERIDHLRDQLQPYRSRMIGIVPTMGYLHQGHLRLVEQARSECDVVVMSIFVNPLQFGPSEDFSRYPRDIERDHRLAEAAGVDFLFTPAVHEMYPQAPLTQVSVSEITDRLCGASRPGHFIGVATVVSKLFHIVTPDRAYFGMKDAQQVAVIQQMVEDLSFPVEIVACDIEREPDGLALSSRNVYLSPVEREQATVLYQALQEVKSRPFRKTKEIRSFLREQISLQPLAQIDYVETLSYPRLQPIDEIGDETVLVAVAVYFGRTRLIDNLLL